MTKEVDHNFILMYIAYFLGVVIIIISVLLTFLLYKAKYCSCIERYLMYRRIRKHLRRQAAQDAQNRIRHQDRIRQQEQAAAVPLIQAAAPPPPPPNDAENLQNVPLNEVPPQEMNHGCWGLKRPKCVKCSCTE